jgi:steroid 5-alpha reductase family enzyme
MHIFRVLAWIVAGVYATIPAFWIFTHPLIERWRRSGLASYRLLVLCWMCSILLVLWITAHGRVAPLYTAGLVPWVAALACWSMGAIIYSRIPEFGFSRFLGKYEIAVEKNSTEDKKQASIREMVSTGMHGWVRHPIYLGHLFMMIGWTALAGTIAVYELLALALLTAPLMIRMEERELVARFGDAYRVYQRRVPMIVPRSVKIFRSPA